MTYEALVASLRRWPGFLGAVFSARARRVLVSWRAGAAVPGLPPGTAYQGRTWPIVVVVSGPEMPPSGAGGWLNKLKRIAGFVSGGYIVRQTSQGLEVGWKPGYSIPALPSGVRVQVEPGPVSMYGAGADMQVL
jgi:hypothetical protein